MFKIKIPKSKKVSSMCKKAATALLSFGTSLSLLSGVMMPSVLAAEPANFTASAKANNWGRSDLRAYLNNATKTGDTLPLDTATGGTNSGNFPAKFSDAEFGLVQPFTYQTNVLDSSANATAVYETTDKFWLPSANRSTGNYKVTSWRSEDISANAQYSKSVADDKARIIPFSYWSYGASSYSWLRSPRGDTGDCALSAYRGHYVVNFRVDSGYASAAAFKINLSSVIFASAASAANLVRDGGAQKIEIAGSADFGKKTSAALPDYGMYLKTKASGKSFTANSLSLSGSNLTVGYTGGEPGQYVVVQAFEDDSPTSGTTGYAAAGAISSANSSVTIDVANWGISSLDGYTVKVWMEDGSGSLAKATVPTTFVGTTKTETGAVKNGRVFALKADLQCSWGNLAALDATAYNNVIAGNGQDGTAGNSSNSVCGVNPTNQKIIFGGMEFWIAGRETAANGGGIDPNGDIMTLYQAKSVEEKQFNASSSNYNVADKPAVTLQLAEGQTAQYTGSTVSYPADQITFKQGDADQDKTTLKWLYRAPGTEAWTAGMPTLRGSYELRCYAEGTDNYERTYSAVVNFTATKDVPTASEFTFTPPENLVEDGTPKEATVTVKPEITGMGEITAIKYFDETDSQLEEPPAAAGTYQVKIDVGPGDLYTEAENLTDPSWTFTITPAPPMPADPPSNPETTPDAPTEEEYSSDALKTGDMITSFTLSGLVLAMTLAPLGFIINTKMDKKKSD